LLACIAFEAQRIVAAASQAATDIRAFPDPRQIQVTLDRMGELNAHLLTMTEAAEASALVAESGMSVSLN
jgi:hypothetical protein